MKLRVDELVAKQGLVQSRSQAVNLIKLGKVQCNGRLVTKAGQQVDETAIITIESLERYVSRAGFKLASVAKKLKLDFKDMVVLDVGSSTGGFTDYALQHGASRVIAVDVGTKQLHKSLLENPKIELHEQTDIRDFVNVRGPSSHINLIVVDVSFISLREILPSLMKPMHQNTQLVAMVKPQFEARNTGVKHKGVIKNDAMRRKVLKDFENWIKNMFITLDKADSEVSGSKGNVERFYLLKKQK